MMSESCEDNTGCPTDTNKENDDHRSDVTDQTNTTTVSLDPGPSEKDTDTTSLLDSAIQSPEQKGETSQPVDFSEYEKKRDYTTENYKIEIKNIPRHAGYKQFTKKLASMGLKVPKMKLVEHSRLAFVNFPNEEERKKGLELLNGHVWKGCCMKAKVALPKQDPMLKRKLEAQENEEVAEKRRKEEEYENSLPEDERVNNVVASYWKTPYEEQLQLKMKNLKEYIGDLEKRLKKQNSAFHAVFTAQKKENNGTFCKVDSILPSPVVTHYRNKCEFTVSTGINGKAKTSGFRLGKYKGGQLHVGSIDGCVLVQPCMKTANKFVESYLQEQSELVSYDPQTRTGHWRTILMRCTRQGHVLVNMVCVQGPLTKEDIEQEKLKVTEYFTESKMKEAGITSLYLSIQVGREEDKQDIMHIAGEKDITEDLSDLKFRISVKSFFQVNTLCAELLYNSVVSWCGANSNTTVLDVCCGTGTIGLSIAKSVKSVIGIEMCASAVEDAQHNAQLNGTENASFHCGRAESVLPRLIHSLCSTDVIAVVDPPRMGLHADVVKAIRNTPYIKKVVYVSCNQRGAMENLAMFCGAVSKRLSGDYFSITRMMPVDLFPQTHMYELLLMLER